MPVSDGHRKADKLYLLQKLYEEPGQALRTCDLARKLKVSEDTALRYINQLAAKGRLVLEKQDGRWVAVKGIPLDHLPVDLSLAEAASLYIAGRLLAHMHDEQNRHVTLALTKLIEAMPGQLRPHQRTLIDMAQRRQEKQRDLSDIFETLVLGWAHRRKVHLLYAPLHNRPKFRCVVCPYLLEPSAVGRTLYIMGKSDPPGEERTYKIERIESAQLTEDTFEIPADFDGPGLLARSWLIMYGDEKAKPVQVRLRFSSYVKGRLKETLWHPTQDITDTPDGCIWSAQIGDTLEIENWIRGWGSDCEVLEPPELREKITDGVRRLARTYGIAFPQPQVSDEPDTDLFRELF